jgi:hypothetical protein
VNVCDVLGLTRDFLVIYKETKTGTLVDCMLGVDGFKAKDLLDRIQFETIAYANEKLT